MLAQLVDVTSWGICSAASLVWLYLLKQLSQVFLATVLQWIRKALQDILELSHVFPV